MKRMVSVDISRMASKNGWSAMNSGDGPEEEHHPGRIIVAAALAPSSSNSRMQEMQYLTLTGVDWVDGLFSEDQVLPCNVEGGIGLVTVRSVSRAVLFLGEKTGDPFDWPEE